MSGVFTFAIPDEEGDVSILRNKQVSKTEFFPQDGHYILMSRSSDGLSFCVVGQRGEGCNGSATFFKRKDLEGKIADAREKHDTTITLTINSHVVKKGKIHHGKENVKFPCRLLTACLRRPV